jgi:hypothetical protein
MTLSVGTISVAASLPQAARLLVLLPDYSASALDAPFSDGGSTGTLMDRCLRAMRGTATRHHVRLYRDYYANPRRPGYMLEIAGELIDRLTAKAVTLIVDQSVELVVTPAWATTVERWQCPLRGAGSAELPVAGNFDAVLLLHSDPLGLGLAQIERQLLRRFPNRVYVLNGRRRCYPLDRRMCRLLGRRRFLAETRLIEAVLARVVRIAAAALSSYDDVFTRMRSK